MAQRKNSAGSVLGVLLAMALPAIVLGAAFAGPILIVTTQLVFWILRKKLAADSRSVPEADEKLAGLLSAYDSLQGDIAAAYEHGDHLGLRLRSDDLFDLHCAYRVKQDARRLNDAILALREKLEEVAEQIPPRYDRWASWVAGTSGANWGAVIYFLAAPVLLFFVPLTIALALATVAGVAGGFLGWKIKVSALQEEISTLLSAGDGPADTLDETGDATSDPEQEPSQEDTASETAADETEDCYHVLGIPSSANRHEIDSAYHQKAKLYHPDFVRERGPEIQAFATELMKKVNRAHSEALARCAG